MAEWKTTRLESKGETGASRSRKFVITVVSGPTAEVGKRITVDGTVFVGSHPDCTLSLSDPAVSRYHVELQETAAGLMVKDLESSNGTFLANARIQTALIETSATLVLGRTVLRVGVATEGLDRPATDRTSFGKAFGESQAMRRLFSLVERAAASDAPVVLLGETGTGKELLAQGIHAESARKDRPFVVVDCGAIAPTLIESELFGHVRGAFTGAQSDRQGAFLEANGGTLFLDEIGELALDLQPKLLRVLEMGTIKRLGEDKPRKVDVRIVAATHRDLAAEMEAGRFRKDLYFRLSVVVLAVPPLRDRREDIPLLVRHFVKQLGRGEFEIPDGLYQQLQAHSWPGNVRELRNVVHRAVIGIEQDPMSSAVRPKEAEGEAAQKTDELVELQFKDAKDKLVEAFTREYLAELLKRCDGNLSAVARSAGLNRNYVHRLVIRFGLKDVK